MHVRQRQGASTFTNSRAAILTSRRPRGKLGNLFLLARREQSLFKID
jgi:hypothetical protein